MNLLVHEGALRCMQAEQVRDRFRADAPAYFALSPQADTEAELARAVKMRTRHLHCDTYQAADDAAEQARWRTAHHLLQTRLATVRAMAGAPAAAAPQRLVQAR